MSLNNRNYNVNPTRNNNYKNVQSPNPFLNNVYRQTYQQQNTPAVRPESPAPSPAPIFNYSPQAPNVAPVYQPDPRNNRRPGGGAYAPPPPALPRPLPLQTSESQQHIGPPPPVPADAQQQQQQKQQEQTLQQRVVEIPGNYEHGEAKKSGSNGLFADLVEGFKLPELPRLPSLPSFFGGGSSSKDKKLRAHKKHDGPSVNGEAIPVSLGVKPQFKLPDVSFSPISVNGYHDIFTNLNSQL